MVYQSFFLRKSTQNGLLRWSAEHAMNHLMVHHQESDKHHRVFEVFIGK